MHTVSVPTQEPANPLFTFLPPGLSWYPGVAQLISWSQKNTPEETVDNAKHLYQQENDAPDAHLLGRLSPGRCVLCGFSKVQKLGPRRPDRKPSHLLCGFCSTSPSHSFLFLPTLWDHPPQTAYLLLENHLWVLLFWERKPKLRCLCGVSYNESCCDIRNCIKLFQRLSNTW